MLAAVGFPAATTCVLDQNLPLVCRSLMPYLLDMLHHPSEHVRGYAARHMSHLQAVANAVIAKAVLNDSGGGLGRLLMNLANSKDFGNCTAYASLVGGCSLHCDADMLKELNNAGACQLVYSLLEQAESNSSRNQLLYSLAVGSFAEHGGDMLVLWCCLAEQDCCLQCLARRSDEDNAMASLARAGPVRLLVQFLEPTPDEVKPPMLSHLQWVEASRSQTLGGTTYSLCMHNVWILCQHVCCLLFLLSIKYTLSHNFVHMLG